MEKPKVREDIIATSSRLAFYDSKEVIWVFHRQEYCKLKDSVARPVWRVGSQQTVGNFTEFIEVGFCVGYDELQAFIEKHDILTDIYAWTGRESHVTLFFGNDRIYKKSDSPLYEALQRSILTVEEREPKDYKLSSLVKNVRGGLKMKDLSTDEFWKLTEEHANKYAHDQRIPLLPDYDAAIEATKVFIRTEVVDPPNAKLRCEIVDVGDRAFEILHHQSFYNIALPSTTKEEYQKSFHEKTMQQYAKLMRALCEMYITLRYELPVRHFKNANLKYEKHFEDSWRERPWDDLREREAFMSLSDTFINEKTTRMDELVKHWERAFESVGLYFTLFYDEIYPELVSFAIRAGTMHCKSEVDVIESIYRDFFSGVYVLMEHRIKAAKEEPPKKEEKQGLQLKDLSAILNLCENTDGLTETILSLRALSSDDKKFVIQQIRTLEEFLTNRKDELL